MKRSLIFLFLCLFLLAMSTSCRDEGPLSYVGKWNYDHSDPALDQAYQGSWVRVRENMDYRFYDSKTQSTFSGTGADYEHSGLNVTLHTSNGDESRVYEVRLIRLKDGVMVVETASVNGVMTEITFFRE